MALEGEVMRHSIDPYLDTHMFELLSFWSFEVMDTSFVDANGILGLYQGMVFKLV